MQPRGLSHDLALDYVSAYSLSAMLGPSAMLGKVRLMRWLLIAFLVSFAALLFAVAGVARHIWRQRAKAREELPAAFEPNGESDLELKQ